MKHYQIGNIINVKVTAVEPYGAFVKIDNEYSGLIHISEITGKFIDDINNYIKIDEILTAKIIDIDEDKKHIKLTLIGVNTIKSNRKDKLEETDLGFFLLKDLLPKWIDDKKKEMKNCK